MITFLKIFFAVVLISMLAVTGWASTEVALWKIPSQVVGHPWFIATLFDAYWGFLTFYCWVFYLERSWVSRVLWLIAVLLLGNIAMASYALWRLCRLPAGATAADFLLRRPQPSLP